jgi:hypothetical protein
MLISSLYAIENCYSGLISAFSTPRYGQQNSCAFLQARIFNALNYLTIAPEILGAINIYFSATCSERKIGDSNNASDNA